MALRVRVFVRVDQIVGGTGTALVGQVQADNPGYGQGDDPGPVGAGQTMLLSDAETVPGTAGAHTVANFRTALVAAADAIAGSSGTPKITAAVLAEINAWQTGSP